MTQLTGLMAPDRAVLLMQGADARSVLQDVVTNDLDRLAPDAPLYAALLTPQGKYLFDFFLLDGGKQNILIDIAAERADALVQRLKMYCLRRDVRIAPFEGLSVGLLWGDALPDTPVKGALLVPDPRDAALGWRLYSPDLAGGFETLGASEGTRDAYDRRRIALGVPETGAELQADETYILEAAFERLNGVDFRKGCYVGQEVTARMKHKTELRKGLVQVTVAGAVTPGTPITRDGKPVGTLFSSVDGHGLAHVRHDRAGPGMMADGTPVDLVAAKG